MGIYKAEDWQEKKAKGEIVRLTVDIPSVTKAKAKSCASLNNKPLHEFVAEALEFYTYAKGNK